MGEAQDRCRRAREWVSLRADGELSELERLLLRRHLSRCEGCRTFAEGVAATVRVLRETPMEAPSRPLAPAPAAVRPRSGRTRRRLALAFALVAIAAASGGLVGGLVGGRDGSTPAPTAPGDIALRPDTQERTPEPPPVTQGEPV